MQQENQSPEQETINTEPDNIESGAAGSLDQRIDEMERQLSEAEAIQLASQFDHDLLQNGGTLGTIARKRILDGYALSNSGIQDSVQDNSFQK